MSLPSPQEDNGLLCKMHPLHLAFSYSSERENNVGLGLSVVSDKVFIEQQTFAYVDFSYKLDMESTQLYLGLKAGGNFYSADPRALSCIFSLLRSSSTAESIKF